MFKLIDNPYLREEILTIIVIIIFILLKAIFGKLTRKFSKLNESLEHRTNLIIKYINILLGLIATLSVAIIWGVQKEQLILFLSSFFAIIGVAIFAQWSLLSNIAAGVILFFSYPFKIGDSIKIHDKDFPIAGEIIDIKAFFVVLKCEDGELITYPNNLLMQKGISLVKNQRNHIDFTD